MMDNKLLYDHLICQSIDYFHVCIVDMLHVGNNTESQLEELSRIECKLIWDIGSITPYCLNQDDGSYCQTKGVVIAKSVHGHYDYLFSCFQLCLYCFYYLAIFCSMG